MESKIYEIEKCECGHDAPLEYVVHDSDGNGTCMPCAIEELIAPSQEKTGWISVENRLPEPNIEVLVCLTYESGRQELKLSYTTERFADRFDSLLHSIITHWQPLPSPPQKPIK